MTFELFRTDRQKPLKASDWIGGEVAKQAGRWAEWRDRARNYVPNADAAEAVNVAIALGKPLLVTGEPGVGKSELAYAIAWQLGLGEPFKFVAKSTSEARDLFYRYDALARFYAIEAARHVLTTLKDRRELTPKEERVLAYPDDPLNFIEYSALGRAILCAHKPEDVEALLAKPDGSLSDAEATRLLPIPPEQRRIFQHPGETRRSVVLIDEIDKASADFCNDLLDEIESLRFAVPEVMDRPTPPLPGTERPFVLITSNRERELPPAFLRRCVYVDIAFPPSAAGHENADGTGYFIETILARRIGRDAAWSALVSSAVQIVRRMRQSAQLTKQPGTAELIDLIDVLKEAGADMDRALMAQANHLEMALRVLVKTPEDLRVARELLVPGPRASQAPGSAAE